MDQEPGFGVVSEIMRSGRSERLPYSLSRWTDVSADEQKFEWLQGRFANGWMYAFDPKTAVPSKWSLKPEDTLGLILWTKHPGNFIKHRELFRHHRLSLQVTLTGWSEVEKNAPNLEEGIDLLTAAVDAFGPERVTWRFSPVPVIDNHKIVSRFWYIADRAVRAGLRHTYVSFLMPNDLVPEPRKETDQAGILKALQVEVQQLGLDVRICKDNPVSKLPGLHPGVCEDGLRFGDNLETMDCGCCLSVDPFTTNESCSVGCSYCYAGDRSLSPKKHSSTRLLSIGLGKSHDT
jgi:hypothetical protein